MGGAPTVRAFIAVEIQASDVVEKIRTIQDDLRSDKSKVRFVNPENVHLTLKFLGNITQEQIETVKSTLDNIATSPYQIYLEGVGCFPNTRRPRVIWIGMTGGVTESTQIQAYLEEELQNHGFPRERRRFKPHITIARVKYSVGDLGLKIQRLQEFDLGSVDVEYIYLKKSTLTPQGPIYTNLHIKKLGK